MHDGMIPTHELDMPIWAVVTFDEVRATNLSYTAADILVQTLVAEKIVSGRDVTIVTADVAVRSQGDRSPSS